MKRIRLIGLPHVASVFLLGVIQSWACSTNSTTTIGVFPNLGGSFFQVNALNAAGQLTGYSYLSGNTDVHAYRIDSNGSILDLGTLGGTSQGFVINAVGHVAGDSVTAGGETHAFLYTNGPLVDLGALGGPFSTAVAINNSDQVVGNYLDADFASLAFIYSGGLQSLGTLGGSSSTAADINDAGVAVGSASIESDTENACVCLHERSVGGPRNIGRLLQRGICHQ
jgi:probable HAF family extracellular repeat protein